MGLFNLLLLIALYAVCIAAAYVVLLVSYRLTLHPLAKYPGPFWAKITDGYGGFNAALRRAHLVTYQNHRKYGPVFRQGPNRLVFNSITAVHDIYQNPRVVKSPVYAAAQMTPQHSVFDTVDVESHRRKRKVVKKPLSEQSMRLFEPTMSSQIDTFISQLRISSRKSEPVNMTERSMWLAGDIAGQFAFGYPLRLQTETTNRWLQTGLAFVNARLNVYMQIPVLHKLEPTIKAVFKNMRAKYIRIMTEMIRARLALPKDAKQDLYSFAGDGAADGESLSHSEIWAEAFIFIVAGGNTIAAALSAMFFYLSRYPDCYERLAEEIRSTFRSAEEIRSGEQLRRCVYLHACINETLRMSTPNTATLWRRQAADDETKGPLVIDGMPVPPGTDIGVNLYSIHHNEEYFKDPFVFRPERWLTSSASELAIMQKAWVPFIIGTQSCPGKAVTLLETPLVFARTFWHFDFKAAPGKLGETGAGEGGRTDGREKASEFQLYDTFSAMHDGPVLMFRSR